MKRTLKRESKVLEIAEREPKETSVGPAVLPLGSGPGALRVVPCQGGFYVRGTRLVQEVGCLHLKLGCSSAAVWTEASRLREDPDEMVFFTPS